MAKFDSKTFNPEVFGSYVERVPSEKKSELARSGVMGSNPGAKKALAGGTGSLYARVPYFGRIKGDTSQNNNGSTDISSTGTTTFSQGFVTASRMDSWTEKSFSTNITSGVDFMDNVAKQIGEYKLEVKQAMLLSILAGIFGMDTEGETVAAKAAKEFVEKHTYDISAEKGTAALVGETTLNTAIQQACGDNKSVFTLAVMHSKVATNLENLKLMNHLTYTDKEGITRDLTLCSWNGVSVLIDDGMPTEKGTDGTVKYTTYILGKGAVILDEIGDAVPYEMSRDPKTTGGQDTLYVRDRYLCGAEGISFEKPSTLTGSASNADLAEGDNWCIINDGTAAVPHKSIAIARIISKG